MCCHLIDGGSETVDGATANQEALLDTAHTTHINDGWVEVSVAVLTLDTCLTLLSNHLFHLIQVCSYDDHW